MERRSDGPGTTRQVVFGEGYVLLPCHAGDATERIRIFDIAWIG